MTAYEDSRDHRGWLLNERASAGRENVDPSDVRRYDEKEDAASAEEVALCRSLGMTGERLSSTPLGSGQFGVAAASHCLRLAAVDVSEVMISALRSEACSAGVEQCGNRSSGLPDLSPYRATG